MANLAGQKYHCSGMRTRTIACGLSSDPAELNVARVGEDATEAIMCASLYLSTGLAIVFGILLNSLAESPQNSITVGGRTKRPFELQ